MPTPRRSSRNSTPLSITTPSHHHKTADELALEEAASLLHTPTARLRSAGSVEVGNGLEVGSARALRHRRLNEVREEGTGVSATTGTGGALEEEEGKEKTAEDESGAPAEEPASQTTRIDETPTDDEEDTSRQLAGISQDGDEEIDELDGDDSSDEGTPTNAGADPAPAASATTALFSAGLSTGQIFAQPALGREMASDEEEEGGSETESEDSGSGSGSDSDSDSDSESDSEADSDDSDASESDSDAEDVRAESLLQAARDAAIAKASLAAGAGSGSGSGENEDSDEVVLQFDDDQSEKKREAPIPDLAVPSLPRTHLVFTKDGRAHSSTPASSEAGPSKRKGVAPNVQPAPELDDRPYERPLTKREKAALPRKATTSELWASIPAPRSDVLPQMRRDYQALALANSLDPKRFMKGGSKSDKVPESFAIGTMVEAPRHLQDTIVTKERKYRPGQVVNGLIRDDDMGAYAKRKYGDLQWNRMENGRGKGRQKKSKW